MMAPSRDSSYKIFTPIVPSTPVRIVTDLLVDAVQAPISRSNENSPQGQEAALTLPVRIAIPQLASSDAQFLISQSPIKSSSILPEMTAVEISPVKQRTQPHKKDLLTSEVKTQLEKHLQEELVVKDAKITYLKGYILQLQSQMVLQRVYCARVRRQLKAKEKKLEKKGKRSGRITGEKGQLLTGSAVFNLVDEYETARDVEAAEREARKQKNLDFAAELAEWTKEEEKRVKRNEEGIVRWQAALDDWNNRKKKAKAARRKVKEWEKKNPKPKKTDPEYHEKAVPKPKKKKNNEENDKEQESNWTDEVESEDDD